MARDSTYVGATGTNTSRTWKWAAALVIEKLEKIAQDNKKNSENPVDNTNSIC